MMITISNVNVDVNDDRQNVIQVQILVTPFRVTCGSTERHWVHCLGTDACIRRSFNPHHTSCCLGTGSDLCSNVC